jgi:hypothetical protein
MAPVRFVAIVRNQYHEVWEEEQGREYRTEGKINGLIDGLKSRTYSIQA